MSSIVVDGAATQAGFDCRVKEKTEKEGTPSLYVGSLFHLQKDGSWVRRTRELNISLRLPRSLLK